jgi:serine protease
MIRRLVAAAWLAAAGAAGGQDLAGLDGDALVRAVAASAAEGQARLSYAELWAALEYTDADPADPAAVLLLYSGRSHPAWDKVSGRLNPEHGPDSWNREHVWPRSHGFADERALAHNDLHHIRAADVTCNADRGSLDFDTGGRPLRDCAARRDADSFEPRDAVKGDVARMLFYMDVRYNGGGGVADLRLVDGDAEPGSSDLGHLCTLLRWHAADPVDELEARRHARIVEVQGNRNPFVDEADLAARVFGPRCR